MIRAYDGQDDMLKVKSMQQKFRDSFGEASLDTTKWDTAIHATQTLSQSAGTLIYGSGTTANVGGYILAKPVFTVPFKLSFNLTLSQRITNQTLYVEVVSVDPITGVPDGKHSAGFVFDGTTATQAKYSVQNSGITPLVSAAVTVPTTAGNGMYEIETFCDEAYFHGKTIDSTAARANSYCRHQQIPDPNAYYKIRMRWLNGSTAPASNTNATFQFVACQDYAELTAEITAGRGQSAAGQGIGVNVIGTVPVSGNTGMGAAAHDAAVSGNPVRIGGRARTSNYTGVASDDVADLIATVVGALVTKPFSIPELDWTFACSAAIVNTTDVAVKAAPAAGIRNYVTTLQIKNTNAVATEVVLKDGSTVIWRGHVSASMLNSDTITFQTPLKCTAATALNFACITTGASVYINVQGYQAP